MTEMELGAAIDAGGGPDGALRPRGIHLHVGSQLGRGRCLARRGPAGAGGDGAVARLDRRLRHARRRRRLPGLRGSATRRPTRPGSPGSCRRSWTAIPDDRRPTRLAIEPGRFLVARAGWLVARVLHVRDRGGRQVVLDAGMTELIRPALYGARHPIVALTSLGRALDDPTGPIARRAAACRRPGVEPTRVDGPICESTDALGVHDLPPLRRGDLVAIADAGAYAASLSSTYNGRPRPAAGPARFRRHASTARAPPAGLIDGPLG